MVTLQQGQIFLKINEALTFTAFATIILINKLCYIAVEIYVLDAAESLLSW